MAIGLITGNNIDCFVHLVSAGLLQKYLFFSVHIELISCGERLFKYPVSHHTSAH